MKSNLTSTLRSTRSAALSRAHFSPVLRGFTGDATPRGLTVSHLGDTNSLTPFWNPRLLDRLQSPLTRFRD